MDGGHINKTRNAKAPTPAERNRRKPTTRPGLPLSLEGNNASQTAQSPDNRQLSQGARAARARKDANTAEDTEEPNSDTAPSETAAEEQEATEGTGGQGGGAGGNDSEASEDTGEGGGDGGATTENDRAGRPLRPGRGGGGAPYTKNKMPKLPKVNLPEGGGMRSPVVPPPPQSAEKKRLDILKSTGMLPANHHATVQQAVDATTAKARAAQDHVIFQTGTIAARARSRITNLSHQVSGVVGAGVTKIRASALAAQTAIDEVTNAQIRAVIAKEHQAASTMDQEESSVAERMHTMLMEDAPQVLHDARDAMNAELSGLVTAAGAKIAGIKSGTEPEPIERATPLEGGQSDEPEEPPDPSTLPPSPPTWDQAEAEIDGQLATGLSGARLTEFANLRCRSALPGLVNPVQEAYDEQNDETVGELDSPATRLRFFNQTMGLVAPTVLAEQNNADPVSTEAYIGNLAEDMSFAYMGLDSDKQQIIRQLDEKRTVLKEQTLNPDYEESQPYKAIEGLRKAGKKIEEGMVHQALMIEASLKANLASLAAEYPGIVARLTPIIDTGGFLEAASVLRQIEEAQSSIEIMQGGQLEQMAVQAELAYAQAQKGLAEQMDSLRDTARESCGIIGETQARITYAIIETGASYTGDIGDGLAEAIPQIHSHAERTAKNLLAPDRAKDGQLTNLKNAAIDFMNGVIMSEWGRYVAELNGLEEQLGGVQHTVLDPVEDSTKPLGMIREGVVKDSMDRAKKVEEAIDPPPMTTNERIVAYGGAALLAPFTLGASVAVAGYDYYSDPNETAVVEALSVPPPGPAGINEAQLSPFRNRPQSLIEMITERMGSEGEQTDILNLFSTDADVSRQAKNNLFAGADSWGGISESAALGLMQSMSAAEVNSEIMTPEENQRMAEALENTLDDPTDREIAAAYMNGEPDQALAIRMRRLIDQQRGKEYNNQLQTGRELDRLVQQELFAGGQDAYIPPAELERMRNAAFMRFDEVSREGHTPVTLRAPEERQQALERGAVSPTQLRTEGRQQDMSIGRADGVGYDSRAGGVQEQPLMSEMPPPAPDNMSVEPPPPPPPPNAPDPLMPREIMMQQGDPTTHGADTADEAAEQAADLRSAQDAVIRYMNRPITERTERAGNEWRQRDMETFSRIDHRHPQASYDVDTGKVVISPASAIQSYNEALIRHGSDSPEARGRLAAATIARIPGNSEPSENQINLLNENFSDTAFNQMRVEWEHATPRERERMEDRWIEAQEDHRRFLRTAAQGMGLDEAQLDDDAAVEAYLTDQLGERFGQVDDSFEQAGGQIISKGRIDIDTGVRLAAEGWGTNEALMQNVMNNRSDHEWRERRANGQTMQTFAYNIADDELSGDDWQQAREKLRGEDQDDLERADTADFLLNQQLEGGTGSLGSFMMGDTWQREDLERRRDEVDGRLLSAAQAGLAEARRRGANIPEDIEIDPVRTPGGELNPWIRYYAMNGDGKLRGDGADMPALVGRVQQSTRYYREEIDRRESFLTSIITAVAVIASVLAMLIPGVNAAVAGIWIALLSGAATVAVKAGMRGNRYGWEEAAVDVGTSVVEAATAGVSGALSKGAQLGAAAKAAKAARDAKKAADIADKMSKLGRLGRAGVAMEARVGLKSATMATEVATNVASGTANAAMNDEMWNDGMGTGLLRLAGHGVQSGVTAAINVGLSNAVTDGLDKRLAPLIGDAEQVGKLGRLGRKLGPEGRELLSEVTGGLAGNLSTEGINIAADFLRHPDRMTGRQALERLGKAGLQELFSTAGKTAIKQRHRARYNAESARVMESGKPPDAADLLLLSKLGESAGVLSPGTTPDELSRTFSQAQARIGQMPPDLQPHLRMMSPEKALQVVAMLDSGQLGNRKQRMEFTNGLGKEIVGLDVVAFDKLLVQANQDHAPERRARKSKVKAARRIILQRLSPEARKRVAAMDLDGLADLPAPTTAHIAKRLADGEPIDDILSNVLPDQPLLKHTLKTQLEDANTAIAEEKAEAAQRRARMDDDLAVATPKSLTEQFSVLSQEARSQLYAALTEQNTELAQSILRDMGISEAAAKSAAASMARHVEAQHVRRNFLDNVPPEHHQTMGQLTPDMLMEIRVAQFTKQPLTDTRIEALLADVKSRRPAADIDTLRKAIGETMRTRHGRPGFRAGLAQKRAFLDLVPMGMKRKVLRTPLITLDDAAFLSFVRGSGSENAVTLIVNGEPVVLMRASADPQHLAEEGLHVLQHHDPAFREKVAGLEERRIARWEELDFDGRMNAYEQKIDIEIDGQRRMIATLEERLQTAWLTSTKTQALRQLELAHETLGNLTARRKEMADLTPEMRAEMRLGLRAEPKWLDQPARMFSKQNRAERDMHELLPKARMPVVDAYRSLLKRVPNLTRVERRRMLNMLRVMKGAVSLDDLVEVLNNINKTPPTPGFEHLSGLSSPMVVDAMQTHIYDTRFNSGNGGQSLSDRRVALREKFTKNKVVLLDDTRGRALVDALVPQAGDPHELTLAKHAIFLSLEHEFATPSGRRNAAFKNKLEAIEAILNIGPDGQKLSGLAGKPHLQAFALEALATSKTLFLDDDNKPQATLDGLIDAVRHLSENGIEGFPDEQQRALFQSIGRAYYEGGNNNALMAIADLPAVLRRTNPDFDRHEVGKVMARLLKLMSYKSVKDYNLVLSRISAFLAFGVNYEIADGAAEWRGKDRISIAEVNDYIGLAMRSEKHLKSLNLIAGRVKEPTDGTTRARVRKKDREAIQKRELADLGQDEFMERHAKPLSEETGEGRDLETTLETVAELTRDFAQDTTKVADPVGLSIEEARSIAKRIKVLDQSSLFSALVGQTKSRDALMIEFIAELHAEGFGPKPPDQRSKQNIRGEKIEKAFRRFVRRVAAEEGQARIVDQLFEAAAIPGKKPIALSAEARTELILILVRGADFEDVLHLDSNVMAELVAAHNAMVDSYLQTHSSDIASTAIGDVRDSLSRILTQGISETEVSAKGIMLEHMVENLLRLSGAGKEEGTVPTLFDDVASATSNEMTEFTSFDREPTDAKRSVDHAISVARTTDKTPPDMEAGQIFGIDSKNGAGAFSKDQFKRYLVEMIHGLAETQDSLFANPGTATQEGASKLAGLIYLANSPDNAKRAHEHAMAALDEVLATADGTHVTFETKDGSIKIEIETLRRVAPLLAVHFGRLSTAGRVDPDAHQLGPITINPQEETAASKIAKKFPDPDAEN